MKIYFLLLFNHVILQSKIPVRRFQNRKEFDIISDMASKIGHGVTTTRERIQRQLFASKILVLSSDWSEIKFVLIGPENYPKSLKRKVERFQFF